MKKRFTILSCLLLCFSFLYAQEQSVKRFHHVGPIPVCHPFMTDSVNALGKKYDAKSLLETSLSFENVFRNQNIIEVTDTSGYTNPNTKSGKPAELHLYGFRLNNDSYLKDASIKIYGAEPFSVFIDGQKKGGNTQVKDSLHLIQPTKIKLDLLPGNHDVVIKYLSCDSNRLAPQIKAVIAEKGGLKIAEKDQKIYTISLMSEGKNINSVSVSPNGKYYLLHTSINKQGKRESKTLLYNEKRLITGGDGFWNNVAWMPKSNKLYYTRKGMDGKELVTLDPETLEEEILAKDLPDGYFFFEPNEKFLLFSIYQKGPNKDKSMIHILDPGDRQAGWRSRSTINKYDLTTGLLQPLSFGFHSVSINSISPDSKTMVFSTSNRDYTKRPFSTSNHYILNFETMKVDTLWENAIDQNYAEYAPDGKKLLVSGSPDAFDGIGRNLKSEKIANSYDGQLFIYDIATKKVDPISKNFNPSISRASWNWNDGMIYFIAEDKDCRSIFRYNPKNQEYTKLNIPEEVIGSFDFASFGNKMMCIGQSVSNANRLYTYNLKKDRSELILDHSAERLKDVQLGEVHNWNFTSKDGTVIEGRYHLPPNFDPNKKYPMLVYYYGGTSPTNRMLEWSYSMHLYAAQGYVVYTLNPSGTTGFGQEFSARHVNAWGKRTADEIIDGTKKFCEEHPFVNKDKIGCMGASYGGFMTQYLQTQTDIFAAAVSHAGISAISSYWGEGTWGIGYCSVANADSYPWNNPDLFVKQSPLFLADKINTPLLLLHGTVDNNVPIGESIQMYNALKILGKTVEFVQVVGENHGVTDFHKRTKWTYTIQAWFAKWLKDQPDWWDSLYPKANL